MTQRGETVITRFLIPKGVSGFRSKRTTTTNNMFKYSRVYLLVGGGVAPLAVLVLPPIVVLTDVTGLTDIAAVIVHRSNKIPGLSQGRQVKKLCRDHKDSQVRVQDVMDLVELELT